MLTRLFLRLRKRMRIVSLSYGKGGQERQNRTLQDHPPQERRHFPCAAQPQHGLVAQSGDFRNSCCESSVVAGVYEPIYPSDLPHKELA